MEVIEEGEDVEWKREVECPHCKSKILITATDLIFGVSRHYRFGSAPAGGFYVKCHDHYLWICDDYGGTPLTDVPESVRAIGRKNKA